jgi:hypothetical protein
VSLPPCPWLVIEGFTVLLAALGLRRVYSRR